MIEGILHIVAQTLESEAGHCYSIAECVCNGRGCGLRLLRLGPKERAERGGRP